MQTECCTLSIFKVTRYSPFWKYEDSEKSVYKQRGWQCNQQYPSVTDSFQWKTLVVTSGPQYNSITKVQQPTFGEENNTNDQHYVVLLFPLFADIWWWILLRIVHIVVSVQSQIPLIRLFYFSIWLLSLLDFSSVNSLNYEFALTMGWVLATYEHSERQIRINTCCLKTLQTKNVTFKHLNINKLMRVSKYRNLD